MGICIFIIQIIALVTLKHDCSQQAKYLTRNTEAGSVEAMKRLDEFVMRLAVSNAECF